MYDLNFFIIRILDLSFIYSLYFFVATGFSVSINRLFGYFDEFNYKNRSSLTILTEILIEIILVGIGAHYIRIIISKIPSPFIGMKYYNRDDLVELAGGVIFAFIIIIFQAQLRHKIRFLYQRIFNESI